MKRTQLVKMERPAPWLVGVISTVEDLRAAQGKAGRAADVLELRLDHLRDDLPAVTKALPRLRSPLIVTARHPAEGGSGRLGRRARRELLLRFLEHAAYVDVELRAVEELEPVLAAARSAGIAVVLSFHDFRDTPALGSLQAMAAGAFSAGAAIFKAATRTDTPDQLARLLSLLEKNRAASPVSVMGMGALGRVSRLLFAQAGSVLNYGHLGTAHVEGQWPVDLLRARLRELESASS